jgi:integration host factor subunit alpha
VTEGKNLTRQGLGQAVNEQIGLSKNDAGDLVDNFFSCIKQTLLAGEDVKLVNFGAFKVRDKSARRGRNPQTGESLEISRRRVVTFKPSKVLRAKVNDNSE